MTEPVLVSPFPRAAAASAGLPVTVHPSGLRLASGTTLPWPLVRALLPSDPRHDRTVLADVAAVDTALSSASADEVAVSVTVRALADGHPHRPGPAWPMDHVPGDHLALGLAWIGADPRDPTRPVPVVPGAAARAGWDLTGLWPRLRVAHERAGQQAAGHHDDGTWPQHLLWQVGSHDPVTVLASATFRRRVCAHHHGLVPAAAATTDEVRLHARLDDTSRSDNATRGGEPGLPHPVLVTADAVTRPAPR